MNLFYLDPHLRRRARCHFRKLAEVIVTAFVWVSMFLAGPVTPLAAVDFVWDGGDGNWDTSSLLWNASSAAWANSFNNRAIFAGSSGTITLTEAITAGGLIFTTTGYNIAGGTLTLAPPTGSPSPAINVAAFTNATISSILGGGSGLTKIGNGTLFLTNNGNTYAGDTVINAGALVITNQSQLGATGTVISINGIGNTGNPGFTGGQLVVNGVSSTGPVTMTREISIGARGPGAANASGGLVSIGSNTFNGDLVLSSPVAEGRILATPGVTTINGDIYLGTGAGNVFLGNGNFIVNGQISGIDIAGDRFVKTGNLIATTLWLTNAANDFRQTIRVDSGTIRVSGPNALGALGTSTSTQALDSNGAFFEIHTDATDFSTKSYRKRGNGGGIFADHDFGSTLLNQNLVFNDLLLDANASFQVNARNGYGVTFTPADGVISWANGGTGALTNNGNGVLLINADINRLSETNARTFTITGNGTTILNGNLLQTGTGAVSLTKAGTGVTRILGIASTATGTTSITNGTLELAAMTSLPSGTINIGNATTTAGALTYIGAGETSGKAIHLNTTTGNVLINNNGTGALILNGTITAVSDTGTKTLFLGGSNTGANEIASAIPAAGGTVNLNKHGAGTWMFSGANLYTGTTTVAGGTLQVKDTFSGSSRNVVVNTSNLIFNEDARTRAAGGIFEYIGDGANTSSELLGSLLGAAGAGKVMVTAGSGGTATLTFSSLGVISAGSGLDFVTNAGASVTITGAINTNGIINAHLFFNGSDFALSTAGVIGAATYTLADTGASLVGGNTAPYLVNSTDITSQSTATINGGIKFDDNRNFTLGATQTLTLQNGAATVSGGILVTDDSEVTISGGTGITSGGAADLVFRTDGDSILNLNTAILASSTGGWTKLGGGTLVLGAANAGTVAGQIHINEGMVQLATGGRLGADSMDVRLRQGASLDLNGISLGTSASATASIDELVGAGNVINSGSLASLRVGNGGGSSTFTGTISGAIDLIKAGAGTVRVQGAQSYSGVVTLLGGNFDVSALANFGVASGLGVGNILAGNAGSLVFNGGVLRYIGQEANNFHLAEGTPSVSIDRLFTLAVGNGTIASFGSAGQNANQGRVANHAALVFNNPGAIAFSGAGNRTLTIRGDSIGDNYMGLQLIDNPNTGTLSITKSESGLWILGNTANSYTGVTSISGGALRADGTALPTASNILLSGGGVFQTSGTFSRALGSGANQIRFSAADQRGGFAASEAPLIVNLGTSGLVWGSSNSPTAGTANFLATGTLYLSSSTSWANTTFVNDFEVTAGINKAVTVTTTNASTTINLTNGNTDGMSVGQAISGTNIPVGAFIASINSATQISISVNATAGGTGIAANVSGPGHREIRVDDNGNTGLDYATVSGVISGGGGLGKVGAGLLILGDANTYTGNTTIREGLLTVTSIGAAGATSSSLGSNVGGGFLEIGNPGATTTANLLYVGSGETVTRAINLVGTTGSRVIDSSGSGALVLTNLNNSTATSVNIAGGAKTLDIRGNNTDGNMITSVLADNGGALTVTKSDGGTWILNPTTANTFTGNINANGGMLGLTTNGIGSAGLISMSSGGIFGFGAPLIINKNVQIVASTNTTGVFGGSNAITVNGNFNFLAGDNDQILSNNLEGGALLTINGNLVSAKAHNRTFLIRGYGSTVWNGSIQNAAANTTGFDIRIANEASFTTTGAANTYTGTKTLGQGTFILDKLNPLGPGGQFNFAGGVLTIGPNIANLAGANAVTNNLFLTGDPATLAGTKSFEFSGITTNNGGDRKLHNSLTGSATLTLSGTVNLSEAGNRTMWFMGAGDSTVSGVIQNGGTATASALRMAGTGTLTLTNTNTYDGATTIVNGMLILSGNGTLDANSVITVEGDGILRLDNSGTNLGDRVNSDNARDINLDGGVLQFVGHASGSSETLGRLDVNRNGMARIVVSGGNSTLTFGSVNFANTGSSLDLTGIASLGTNNRVFFTAAPSGAAVSNGVLSRVAIGSDFAEYNVGNGVQAFTSYNNTASLVTPGVTDTVNLTASANIAATRTINALRLNNATDLTVGSDAPGATLTLTSGALIAAGGGTHTLNVPIINSGANGAFFQVAAGTTLEIDTVITGAAFTALQGGTINFNEKQFFTSSFNHHAGTVNLLGGLNTIMPLKQAYFLNSGATLDLNGNTQFIGNLSGSGEQPGDGGSLVSTGGTGTIVTDNGGSWMGVISGAVNLGRVGGGTLTIGSDQTYTGWTYLTGGTTTLRDNGALSNTSGMDINLSLLAIRNNDNLQLQNNNRINDAAAINLRGGTIDYGGRVLATGGETFGALSALMGANTLTATNGGTSNAGAFSATLVTFASLSRTTGATINFTGSNLGSEGNNSKIIFTAPLTAIGNGVLGAWAIANSSDYAAYNQTNGVGVVGNGGFVGYDADFASGSITNLGMGSAVNLTTTLNAGTTTTSLLRFHGDFINDLAFTNGGDILNLELGGILRSSNNRTTTIGTTGIRGVITAGGTEISGTRELVIYNAATGTTNFAGGSTTTGSPVVTMTSTAGLAPGMTLTGTGVPAGSTILSVDSSTQVTLTQNSTATAAGTITFAGSTTNMTIHSVIADNGLGNSVQFVKSGAGTLILSGNNTYTGGTVINQGTVNLTGSGTIIPGGGITLTGGILNTSAAGQIHSSNIVTLNGSSTLTLIGANTLNSLVFNHIGGTTNPTVTTNGVLTLTNATPISVTSNSAIGLPTITGFLDLGAGAKSFAIDGHQMNGVIYDETINRALNITANINAPGAITKTGTGLLGLGGQNNFASMSVTGGGLVIAASSTGTAPSTLVSGPLGIGTVAMAAGTRLSVDDSSRTVANAFTFASDPIFGNTGTSTDTMTLNGALTFATLGTTGLAAFVETPYLNVVLGGPITGIGAVTSVGSGSGANTITKTGPGNISGINLTGISDTATINLNGLTNLNTFSLLHDGDTTSSTETVNLGAVTWTPANGSNISLTIGRAGNGVNYATALYKTISLDSLTSSVLPNGITLANNNNYGLIIPDSLALASGNIWTVNTANTSLQPAGLELSGVISGSTTLTKAGNGILKLSNAGNSFTGTVDITNGTVEGASDAVFGDAANIIRIGSNSVAEGLRISGTFATNRIIHLNAADSGIDVTGSNVFTLNNAFTFATATNNLRKNDLGTLVLSAAQTGWNGNLIVQQGVLRISDGASLGTTTGNVQLGNVGAALELTGGVTVNDAILINTTDGSVSNGINGGGAVRSTSGINTLVGLVTIATTTADSNLRGATMTADMGATLNITGGIVIGLGTAGSNRDNHLGLGGAGTINLTTTTLTQTGSTGTASLSKFGTGTLNIQVANAFNLAQGQNVIIKQGTLSLNGLGTLGTSTLGSPGRVVLNPTGILEINNTLSNVNNRLSGRNISVSGADINVFGHAGGSTETAGLFSLREGLSKITLDADSGGALNFATGALTRNAQATLLIRADNFGTASAAGVATFTGSSYAYAGQVGNAGTVTKGILPWALGDTDLGGSGIGFVTSDTATTTGTAILRLLAPSEQTANFGTTLANVNLSTAQTLSTLDTFNSLRLGSGGGVTLNYVPLTLDSGGLLVLSGHGGISGFSGVSYLSTTANRELIIHNNADLTLNIPIAGTTGALTKSGTGNLTLASRNSNHGTVMVNDGTLTLGGGDQTILPGRNMWVNEGGTLDLNGTTQFVGTLASRLTEVLARNDLFTANSGGSLVNNAIGQATLAIGTGETFTGTISGNIAIARSTASGATTDWNLYSDNNYSGPSLFNGGRVVLYDNARLSGTSSIEISNATFLVGAGNATIETSNITDRVNDAASILIRGGMFQIRNRAALYVTESFGDVTIGEGGSFIDFAAGGTAINQTDSYFDSLARIAGSRGTLRFMNVAGTPSGSIRLFIDELNGVATTNINDGLTNHLIGGWATHDREFASYIPGQGVAGLNTAGYAGYSPNLINNGTATDNIRIALPNGGSTTLLTANRTLNSLNIQAPAAATASSLLDLGGNTLTLASGGLILSPVSTTALALNLSVVNGDLTAGTTADPADLYVHALSWVNNQATNTGNADVTIGARIVDNSTGGAVSLVIVGNQGRGTLAATNDVFITGENTYTGGTWVNSGRIVLNTANANGTSITATGTGDLTITGGYGSNPADFTDRNTQVIYGASDQVRNSATVNVMGGAQWNLNNFSQTIAALNFNNHGGTAPNVTTGTGTLTVTGDISAVGQNAGSNAFSTINGKLNLAAATTTLTVDRIEWNGEDLNPVAPNLLINAVIEGNNIVKDGTGLLRLSGGNAWAGNFDLQSGGLSLGSNNALSSGLLTIGDGTFLTSTADNRVINNAYTVSGDFALSDAFNLTMAGAGTLTAGDHEISVDLATKILTLSGIIGGASGNLNKTGDGILLLGNSNTYGGTTTVSDGILRYGIADALPTGTALTVLEGALLDITLGGANVMVGSLAGNSATQGGLIYTGATSGTVVFTAGGNNTSTAFGGVLANAAGSTLEFVKTGSGTLTLGGANQYNGSTTVVNGRLIAKAVGGNSPLGTSQSLIMGGGSTAGILQLGDSGGILNHTFTSLTSAGTATTNQIVSGNAAMATLTLDLAFTSTFAGNIGGGGSNEGNLNLIKNGAGDLVISGTGTSTYSGTTTVNGGKLYMDTPGAYSATTAGLTLADGTEFALRGSTLNTVNSYGFSGTGNVITVGSTTGATLGFSLDGSGNTRLNVASGQTMTVNGTLTTAVYVNSAPVSLQDYILISGVDPNSLHAGGGAFDLNPVIFNGGSFTYALRNETLSGTVDQWILTPTAVPSAPDTWWKGDLTGIAAGVWSATLTTGTGAPSNWDTNVGGAIDALVPPDQDSIVHFSATGAANFATTLGANMTIQELIFHTGNAATTIGSSNGVNTLTLGNTVDSTGITLQTGVGNVGISAIVALAQNQSWNIEDSTRVLTLSGGLTGTSRVLTVNDTTTDSGTLLFSGSAATMTGTLNQNAGILAFEDTGSLNSALNVVLGTAAKSATLKVGNTTAATGAVIGGLSNGAFAGSRVIGGNATTSTLTIGAESGSHTFSGAVGGAGTNENNFNLVKAGAGTQILNGAITYTGTTLVRAGTLQLGAASTFGPTLTGTLSILADPGATAVFDNFGKSFTTAGVTTLGGNGVGSVAQLVDSAGTKGTITLGGNVVYDGTFNGGMATIGSNLAFAAARTISVGDSNNSATDLTIAGTIVGTGNVGLTFDGLGNLAINGNITNSGGTAANINFNGPGTRDINAVIANTGTMNVTGGVVNANVGLSLDAEVNVVVTGTGTQGSAIVNINTTSQVQTIVGSGGIYIRNGGLVNVTQSGGIGTGSSRLWLADTASASAAAAAVLNLDTANISVGATGILVGNGTNIGHITGSGTITTAGIKDLRTGTIAAGITLAGNGGIIKQGTGTLTFFGDRDNASTGATTIQEGNLILDYNTNNNSKIGGVLNLGTLANVLNGTLTLNGSSTAATTQAVASTAIRSGNTNIVINNSTGQTATLNLGAISRTVANGAGVVSFEYSSNDAKATSSSPAGTMGYATLVVGVGPERFAAIDSSGDIVQVTQTTQNALANWGYGQDIINNGVYSGTITCGEIASLTFAHAGASTVSIASGGYLGISSGGIMVDASVGAFNSTITGGSLFGATNSGIIGEIIVHQNSTAGTLTIASNIASSGGITKAGLGTLILSGNNNLLRGAQVSVNEGILRLASSNAINGVSSLLVRAGATLDVNGNNVSVGHLLSAGGTIALGTNGAVTFSQTANTTYGGVFTGGAGSSLTFNSLISAADGSGFNLNYTGATTTAFTGSVVVNSGLLQLSVGGRLANASAFTINKNGTLLLDNNGGTTSNDRILNTASITLNSADGAWSGTTQPRGLSIRRDQGSALDETVGAITFNSGASYASLEATAANGSSKIIATNFVRANKATLNVRGTNLGSASAQNAQFRIATGANQTAFITSLVGGGGAAGTQSISIVPWAIGETVAGSIAVTNMGNSLVTYVVDAGFRPLSFTTEYDTYTPAAATENVRENLAADLTGLAGKTINSLAINRNVSGAGTTNVTGSGASQTLTNTSGAFLFTLISTATNSTAHNIVLGGFNDGIQVGSSNEYVFHVVNPSSALTTATLTARINSSLNTVGASLTKSGRGTLELNAVNLYTGGTTINEGVLQISSYDNVGSGGITLAGGTLRAIAVFDLGARSVEILSGGGTIDIGSLAIAATNLDLSGSGTLTKIGTGTLTINDSNVLSHTGRFVVGAGIVVLNNSLGNSLGSGGVLISGSTNPTVLRLGQSNQIADTANVELVTTGSNNHLFDLNNFSEIIGGLALTSTTTSGAVVRTGATGVLTVSGDIVLNNDRVNDGNTTEFQMLITGTGSQITGTRSTNGFLDLGGTDRRIVVQTNVAVPNRNDAVIETVIQNGGIIKEGNRVLYLRANNTYAGSTTINNGTISISSSGNLGDGSVTNTIAINNGATLQSTGANVDLGTNRSVLLGGMGGAFEVTGSNILTISGVISSAHDCAELIKIGTGRMVLTGANDYTADTVVRAGILQLGDGTSGSIGAASALSIESGATLEVNLADNGVLTNDIANAGTLNATGANTNSLSGDISGTGAVTQSGTGTTILSGTNTYSGVTTVNNGILQFARQVSLYNNIPASWTPANITVSSGATVAFNVGGAGEFTTDNVSDILTNLSAVTNNGLRSGSTIGFDTTNASGGSFTVSDTVANSTGTGGGSVGVTKLGTNTLVLTANNTYTGDTTISEGVLQLGNGGNTGSVGVAGDIINNAALVVDRSNDYTISNEISGTGSFEQAGPGTTTLTGTNSYTGSTTVSDGALYINGDNSAATGGITVGTGATLGGTGTIGDATTLTTIGNGATITAGDQPNNSTFDNLSFNGDLTVGVAGGAATTWLVDLVGGTGSDRIDVAGALNLTDTNLAINFSNVTNGNSFVIASYGSLTGGGAFLNDPLTEFNYGGQLWTVDYGTGSNSFITLNAVPEPGTFGLLGLALAGLAFLRFRKRRNEAVAAAHVAGE